MHESRGVPTVAALLLAALAILGLATGRAESGSTAAPNPVRQATSTKNSPGYISLVDPESTSVRIGRRLDAPGVSRRFQGGARSLDDLGRVVCRALHHVDQDSLRGLCLREDEFRDIVWRELPQSRPVTGLEWEDGWRVLSMRLESGCSQALHDHGGHYLEFVGFEAESISRYRNFTTYSRLTLIARDDEGRIQRNHWIRAVVERKGSFKIFSTED